MINGRIYLDRYFQADYPTPFEVLGWFLEHDIQGSRACCDMVLGICVEIADGRRLEWKGTGNAHTVSIEGDSVLIENNYAIPEMKCEVSIGDFMTALRAWRDLIQDYIDRKALPPTTGH